MEAGNDFVSESRFRVTRIAALVLALILDTGNFLVALQREQVVPVPHQIVGNRHDLAEHAVRGLGDTDVVVLRLAHLVHAVEADKQRHRQNALRFLAVLALELAADDEVKALVRAAELEVGVERDRVIALHQRVEELMHRDRQVFTETLREVIALKEAGKRVAGSNKAHGAERV